MPRALEVLHVDWPDRRRAFSFNDRALLGELKHRRKPFWERNADRLEELAYAVRQAYLRRVRAIRADLTENHDLAVEVIDAYYFCRRMLSQRGIEM